MAQNRLFYINHPGTGDMVAVRYMNPGEKIEPSDFYLSNSGRVSEPPCAGLVIQAGCETSWVRPIDPETGEDR